MTRRFSAMPSRLTATAAVIPMSAPAMATVVVTGTAAMAIAGATPTAAWATGVSGIAAGGIVVATATVVDWAGVVASVIAAASDIGVAWAIAAASAFVVAGAWVAWATAAWVASATAAWVASVMVAWGASVTAACAPALCTRWVAAAGAANRARSTQLIQAAGFGPPPCVSGLAQPLRGRIERHRSRIRHVEALEHAGQFEPRADITDLARQLTQAAPFRAEHQRERLAQLGRRKIDLAFAVEPDGEPAAVLHLGERAPKILHRHHSYEIERAGRRFCKHAGGLGRMPRGRDDCLYAEGRRGAQDRADIVRIGDLVEKERGAFIGKVFEFERGKGLGFHKQAVMHGIRREPCRDRIRPHDLGRDGKREALVGETARGVLGCDDLAHRAARIGECGGHGVPAVENRDAFRNAGAHRLRLGRKPALVLRRASLARRLVRLSRVPGFLGHARDVSRSAFASNVRRPAT